MDHPQHKTTKDVLDRIKRLHESKRIGTTKANSQREEAKSINSKVVLANSMIKFDLNTENIAKLELIALSETK
jgi:hypothetical protein